MANLTTAWQCDEQGVLIGEMMVQEDPIEAGTYLLPAGCVLIAPPAFDSHTQMAVFADDAWSVHELPLPREVPPNASPIANSADTGSLPVPTVVPTEANKPVAGEHELAVIVDGQWTVVPDWRGLRYWLANGSAHRIVELGDTPPDDARFSPPPKQPAPALRLDEAKAAQIAMLRSAYESCVHQPVSFTTATGDSSVFACDPASVDNLQAVLAECCASQAFPPNLWLDVGGLPVTPFKYADLQGLAQAIASRPVPSYQSLLAKIGQVMSATNVPDAQTIAWRADSITINPSCA